MGFRFRKSIKLAPGVKLNIGKKGVSSLSVGKNGARVNISKKGTKSTVGLPGTGLSYSSYSPHKSKPKANQPNKPDFTNPDNILGYPKSEWVVAGIVLLVVLIFFIWLIF